MRQSRSVVADGLDEVSTWPDHIGEVLGMSWSRMAFLALAIMSGIIPFICLFFADFSPGTFAASRALSMGSRRFPGMPFVCLFPLLATSGLKRGGDGGGHLFGHCP